ncbi:MAG: hypothetical protein LUF81_03430 [Clostridiales bacterium]|nr:hypothetical protein [Clostridiales bacterium]
MSRPIYRRGEPYAKKAAHLLRYVVHPELDPTLDQYELALVKALRTRLTPRETECMVHYYLLRENMQEAARRLGINLSTVSRTVDRGEAKLDDLLKLAVSISPIRLNQDWSGRRAS